MQFIVEWSSITLHRVATEMKPWPTTIRLPLPFGRYL